MNDHHQSISHKFDFEATQQRAYLRQNRALTRIVHIYTWRIAARSATVGALALDGFIIEMILMQTLPDTWVPVLIYLLCIQCPVYYIDQSSQLYLIWGLGEI